MIKKRTVFWVFLLTTILWILFMVTLLSCQGAENKPVSQSTSAENKIRRQQYNACVQQTGSTSKCYYLYYG